MRSRLPTIKSPSPPLSLWLRVVCWSVAMCRLGELWVVMNDVISPLTNVHHVHVHVHKQSLCTQCTTRYVHVHVAVYLSLIKGMACEQVQKVRATQGKEPGWGLLLPIYRVGHFRSSQMLHAILSLHVSHCSTDYMYSLHTRTEQGGGLNGSLSA